MAVRRSRPFRAVLGIVAMVVGTVAVPGLVRPAEARPSTADGLIAFSFGVQLPPADEDLFFPSDIYTVRPDGTGLRQLTHVPDGATAALPSWSPAGGAIAYQSDAGGGDYEIWSMGAHGEGNHRVLRDPGRFDLSPSWTPDGRRIVFSRCDVPFGFVTRCALAIVNADGTGLRTIVDGNNFHLRPVVSPDGRKVAFMSDKGGLQSAIWVADIDGRNLRRLTTPRTRAFWPEFTPDGRHLLYSNNCCLPHSNVFSVPVGGGAATQITHVPAGQDDAFAAASPSGKRVLLLHSEGNESALVTQASDGSQRTVVGGIRDDVAVADWGSAPLRPADGDGSRLPTTAPRVVRHSQTPPAQAPTAPTAPAGTTRTAPGAGGTIVFADFIVHQLFAVSGSGGRPRQITHFDADHHPNDPALSADGRHVTFVLGAPQVPARIWVIDSDGKNAHPVGTESSAYNQLSPTFTPDGRIVFSRCADVCNLWITDVDGGHRHAITPYTHDASNEATDWAAAVAPDGRHIAFQRFLADGFQSRLFVADIDGRNAHPVTPPWLEAGNPAWSPQGGKLAVTSQDVFPRLGLNIWTVRPDGSDLTRLTSTPYPNNDDIPSFSPDGTRIGFVSDRRYDDFCCQDLFAMRTDGRQEQQIPTGSLIGVGDISWGPSVAGAPAVTHVLKDPPVAEGQARPSDLARPSVRCRAPGPNRPSCRGSWSR